MHNENMNFSEILQYYRERAGLQKNQLADKLGVKPSYIGSLEKGRDKPPTLERCHELSKALNLSRGETKKLIDSAMEERLSTEAIEWISQRYTPKIIEALNDPLAVKALLTTHSCNEEVKKTINEIIECIPKLNKEEKIEMMKICQE